LEVLIMAIVFVLLLMCVVVVAWWLLLDAVYSRLKPSLDRWLWRKLGGEGNPPKDD
jgi:hypothetical protein